MKFYSIPMVPGPVRVPEEVLAQYQVDYGSADLETEFLDLYNQTEKNLQEIYVTKNRVAIQSGEGMLVLWGALKSCILPGERVLSIGNGIFGYGIADMAKSIGAEVKIIGLPYNQTVNDWGAVETAIVEFMPKMITVVHCETPSGTLNPLVQLGDLKRKYNIPLLYADVVASLGGAPLLTDEWAIDLALGASQKCLSAPPGMSFLAISDQAWEIIEEVNYVGYDALKPFRTAQEDFYFPYTPHWHGVAGLHTATQILLAEGVQQSCYRHERVASYCRDQLVEMGLSLYPHANAVPSPTVTAVKVPDGIDWEDLDSRFRQHGLVVGGNYGPLQGKIFRLGHMGTQADMELAQKTIEVVRKAI